MAPVRIGRSVEEFSAYSVIDVRADDETFLPAIMAVLDGNDVTGLWEWRSKLMSSMPLPSNNNRAHTKIDSSEDMLRSARALRSLEGVLRRSCRTTGSTSTRGWGASEVVVDLEVKKVETKERGFYRLDKPQGGKMSREAAMRQLIVTVTRTGISRVMMAALSHFPL